jgi:hypothetical protein
LVIQFTSILDLSLGLKVALSPIAHRTFFLSFDLLINHEKSLQRLKSAGGETLNFFDFPFPEGRASAKP